MSRIAKPAPIVQTQYTCTDGVQVVSECEATERNVGIALMQHLMKNGLRNDANTLKGVCIQLARDPECVAILRDGRAMVARIQKKIAAPATTK